MVNKHNLLSIIMLHYGKARGIHVKELANQLGTSERRVRKLVTQCREDGIAICGQPNTGYFVALTSEELHETLDFLKDRALHSLKLMSKLSNIPMADLIGQLHLKT